jgi:hypothetical protein
MNKVKTALKITVLCSLFAIYGVAETKSFEASRTQVQTEPTSTQPTSSVTYDWTDSAGESGSVTKSTSQDEATIEGSNGEGATFTGTSSTTTDDGEGTVTDATVETNSGKSAQVTSTWSQPESGEGQMQYTITGDDSPDNSLTITDDYGGTNYGTYTSSGTNADGGTESGSTTTDSDWNKSGTIYLTPGTNSEYYGESYEVDYSTDSADQSVSGTVTEEPTE